MLIEEEAALKRKGGDKTRAGSRKSWSFPPNGEHIAPDAELKAELDPAAVVSRWRDQRDINEVKKPRNVDSQDITGSTSALIRWITCAEYERKDTDKGAP